jgi:hypothetical protein
MRRLLDWERNAIVDAVASNEKLASICSEFNVCHSYPGMLAKRRGLKSRPIGRPKSPQLEKPVLAT